MQIKSNILGRLFCPSTAGNIADGTAGVVVRIGNVRGVIAYGQLLGIDEKRGWFWSTITIRSIDPKLATVSLSWVPKAAARHMRSLIFAKQITDPLALARTELFNLAGADRWLGNRTWLEWENRHRWLLDLLPSDVNVLPLTDDLRKLLSKFLHWMRNPEQVRAERNRKYLDRELKLYQSWFDQLERYPLTQAQRTAIVCDEDNNLVVAGAGTGKTSTIVGKVGRLLRKAHVQPAEILLLAFARKAKEEMQQRIAEKFGVALEVRTFHSLGLEIVSRAEGARPSVSALAEAPERLAQAIDGYFGDIFADESGRQIAVRFFTRYRYLRHSDRDFGTAHAYYQYLKAQDIKTLRGERVKSFGELEVADFLTANGVKYKYEAPYEYPTATIYHRQYKPDFYLPDYGIYIEYFGIDRQGGTAPYIDRKQYTESMDWKRQTHRELSTTMVEVFSYELWEGTLNKALADRLTEHGVTFQAIDPQELQLLTRESGEASRIGRLLCSFLNLFKSNTWSRDELRQRIAGQQDAERAAAFLDLFELVLARYEAELAAKREIDFHDMIVKATQYAEEGKYRSAFRYILVDEFQDISRGRARLLNALLAQHRERWLFCVGDDWQSIYRFSGSDVGIMTGFQEQFGHTLRTDLDQTFRFSDEILRASSNFILKNPAQLKKQLSSLQELGRAAITIYYEKSDEPQGSGLRRALDEIQAEQQGEPANVMVLGRYHFALAADLEILRKIYPALALEQRTVHGAKGLEADIVIVLDVNRGRYGFPTEISDDPLLGLVLAQTDSFPNAEERRLFYVALTRARKRAFLVTDEGKRSVFVEELEGPEYSGLVESHGATARITCPKCQGGSLVIRRGDFGMFWGCSNYPYCDGKADVCQRCGRGAFVRRDRSFVCSNDGCDARAEGCPQCTDGMLKLRQGRFGAFLGCSNWSPDGLSCDYTRNMRRER